MRAIKLRNLKVVFIGTGNLTKALIQALLNSGLQTEQITVVARATSDLSWFEGFQLMYHTQFSKIDHDATHIFLTVDPEGAGYALSGLKSAGLEVNGGYKILSFVPGIMPEMVSDVLNDVKHRVIIARCNTAISYGKQFGLVYANDNSGLLDHIGEVFLKEEFSEESMISASLLTGCHCVAARMAAKELEFSLPQYVTYINRLVGSNRLYKSMFTTQGDNLYFTKKYIDIILKILRQNFFYSFDEGRDHILMTFVNTVKTLGHMTERGIGMPDPSIVLQNTTIGAEELKNIKDPSHLLSYDFLDQNVFMPFYDRVIEGSYGVVRNSMEQMKIAS